MLSGFVTARLGRLWSWTRSTPVSTVLSTVLATLVPSLVLLSGSATLAHAAQDRLLFWETTTPGSKVYLLGSMHLASADVYPLRDTIMQAFNGADKLVVELDISGDRQLLVQQRMLERGMYRDGRTLQDDLSPDVYRELSQRLADTGLPIEMLQGMKPGLVVTTLSTMEMMKLGLNPERGVDRYFLTQARGAKPILELETVDRQLDVVLDFPDPELLVRQSLSQLDDMEALMNELVDSWKRGDSGALGKLVIEDELRQYPEYEALHERMFDDRNREMTEKILGMQRQGGTYFVVVGAGHLVGEQGIVAMLERQGQSPRQR